MSNTTQEGRRISVHEAAIKTAEVSIKALTVGRKQVTLNVYRQLQREDLINPDTAELNGVPWGRVNYFPPKECEPNHLHVVWQKGSELRRACVYQRPVHPWDSSMRYYPSGADRHGRAPGLAQPCDDYEYMLRSLAYVVSFERGYKPGSRNCSHRNTLYSDGGTKYTGSGDECVDYTEPLAVSVKRPDVTCSSGRLIRVPVSRSLCLLWEGKPHALMGKPEDEPYTEELGPVDGEPARMSWEPRRYDLSDEGTLYQVWVGGEQRWWGDDYHRQEGWRSTGYSSEHTAVAPPAEVAEMHTITEGWREKVCEEADRYLHAAGLPAGAGEAQIQEAMSEKLDDIAAFEQTWGRHYKEIEALDQLFIAA